MRSACPAAALAAVLSIAPARADRLTDFELTKLNDWGEAIAVCDVTGFLITGPDVDADVILVSGRGRARLALHHPLYVPPTNFFSEPMRETFEKLRKAGLVTREAYNHARIHYARRMIEAYRNASPAERNVLIEQMELCHHLAARVGAKHIHQERQAAQ